jgi:hypothetical protein
MRREDVRKVNGEGWPRVVNESRETSGPRCLLVRHPITLRKGNGDHDRPPPTAAPPPAASPRTPPAPPTSSFCTAPVARRLRTT